MELKEKQALDGSQFLLLLMEQNNLCQIMFSHYNDVLRFKGIDDFLHSEALKWQKEAYIELKRITGILSGYFQMYVHFSDMIRDSKYGVSHLIVDNRFNYGVFSLLDARILAVLKQNEIALAAARKIDEAPKTVLNAENRPTLGQLQKLILKE